MDINDLIDDYVNEIKNSEEFRKLIRLKEIIDSKYKDLIIKFKTCESLYLEAKERNYLDDSIINNFVEAKKNLYSKDEVKNYFILENKLDEKLNNDFNEIKENISNKFSLNNWPF